MELWSRKPKKLHTIEKIDRDKIWCVCGWEYKCKDSDKMPKAALENDLLDVHRNHTINMKDRGL
jgi:hypothetical protein